MASRRAVPNSPGGASARGARIGSIGSIPGSSIFGRGTRVAVLTDLDRYAFELLLVTYFAEREGLALPAPLAGTVTPGRLSPRVAGWVKRSLPAAAAEAARSELGLVGPGT
jgi:hypothetical protein